MSTFSNDSFEFFDRSNYKKIINMPSLHHHDYHELYYLVKGEATYFVGNSIFLLKSGDFCFISKGELHKTNYDESKSIERILLKFDDGFLGKEYKQFVNLLRDNKHIQLEDAAIPLLEIIFQKIEKECNEHKKNYKEMNQLYLREIMLLLNRHSKQNSTQSLNNTNKIVQSAVLYIEHNYSQNLSVASLASMYSLSVGYFSKMFKQITGVTPNEYIIMTRITAAKEKLSRKNVRITDVATECGFSDSNYFAMVFKKSVGITPKKYATSHTK